MSAASESLIEHITDRRSARSLAGSAPTAEELARILQAAVTVPDHGGLRPFLFVVVADDARTHFGAALAASFFSSVLRKQRLDGHRRRCQRSAGGQLLVRGKRTEG